VPRARSGQFLPDAGRSVAAFVPGKRRANLRQQGRVGALLRGRVSGSGPVEERVQAEIESVLEMMSRDQWLQP